MLFLASWFSMEGGLGQITGDAVTQLAEEFGLYLAGPESPLETVTPWAGWFWELRTDGQEKVRGGRLAGG